MGEVSLEDGTQLHAKALMDLQAGDVVHVDLARWRRLRRSAEARPEKVLWDVIDGYITAEDAESKYGVAIRYEGNVRDSRAGGGRQYGGVARGHPAAEQRRAGLGRDPGRVEDSFQLTGTPSSGPRRSPARARPAAASASKRARSGVVRA